MGSTEWFRRKQKKVRVQEEGERKFYLLDDDEGQTIGVMVFSVRGQCFLVLESKNRKAVLVLWRERYYPWSKGKLLIDRIEELFLFGVSYGSIATTVSATGISSTSTDSSPLSPELEATIEKPPFGTKDDGWESAVQGIKTCCPQPQAFKAAADRVYTLAVDAAGKKHGVVITDFKNQAELVLGIEGNLVSAVFWRSKVLPLSTVRRVVRDVQNYLTPSE